MKEVELRIVAASCKLIMAWLVCQVSCGLVRGADPQAIRLEFDRAVGQYFHKNCLNCHNADKQEGEFRLDKLSKNVGVEDTALWAEVRERISSGEMPPSATKNRPSAEESAAVVQWLSEQITTGESERLASRERVSFHRLTREEYVNTVYDLLGVYYDATDPGGLTEDPQWHGFERIGSILSLSPSHIEKYLQAAETVLQEAYPDKEIEPVEILKPAVPPTTINEPYKSRLAAAGLLDKVRCDVWPQDQHRYAHPGRLPAPGVYEVTIKLSGLKPIDGRAPRVSVYHQKLDRILFEQDVVAPEDAPTTVTFRTHLPEGHQDVMVTNDVPGPSNLPRSGRHGNKPFVSIKDGRIAWQLKLTDEVGQPLYPFLILDWTKWTGPVREPHELQLRADYMPTSGGDHAQARVGLLRLARRAFRRPVEEAEIDPYVRLLRAELDSGSNFRTAMRTAMQAILCSKNFLFIVEGSPDSDRRELNDWELATRLSYLFWNSMPDELLFSAAQRGELSNRDELLRQCERLMASSRINNFYSSFTRQWLQLRRVGMFAPDAKLYPEYDKHLERSMIAETTAFFGEVVAKNLTLREFLHSDWTMVNARLALHYGIPNVQHDDFQRVALRPEDHRGGLLTQAAILSLSSDGTRHRPVHRGVWLSECILGKSPPPPPANVDAIEPNPVDAPKATLRQKLNAHQENASCAACHRKIDPLGLAFDNYDAIGSWRTEEKTQGVGDNPRVDASGELPDGRKFADADEFKSLLLQDLDKFSRTFIDKLAIYALRRTLTFEDREELDRIAVRAKQDDYRLPSIIKHLVDSRLFRCR